MKEKIENLVKDALKSLNLKTEGFSVEHPTDLKMGDYSTNVAIKYGHKDEIVRYIVQNKLPEIEKVELAGPGFINFYLSKEFFINSLKEIIEKREVFGKNENLKGKKFFVEHTQPNIFKEFHIGHLMNNIIGESVTRIVKAGSAEVKTASYHGDVGMHVAKAVWALLNNCVGNAYAMGNKAYEEDKEAKNEIQEINKKIYERSDDKINDIYDSGRKESLKEFDSIYKRLNTNFDYSFFESESGDIGKELVLDFLKKGIFEESEGAVVFRGDKFGLHTRVFLNSDKLPTYEAKEIGLAKIKKETFPFDQSITITANEQDAFFQVVEVVTGEVMSELKGKLIHLSHGMLRLPTGKMSSRTGNVITAEKLIEDVKKKVKDNEQVAIGAIKYIILRQVIGNDIIFDIEKSVSTEGDSGVYLQYAYARTNSLLEKAKMLTPSVNENRQGNIRSIERLLYRFPEVVERAGKEYAPHYIITYLTEIAGSFNNFYAHEQVIGDSPESAYRLAIVQAFNIVMKNGLTILGIPTPERL